MAFHPFIQFGNEHLPANTCLLTGGRTRCCRHLAESASEIQISITEQTAYVAYVWHRTDEISVVLEDARIQPHRVLQHS